jgi:hypothetical protein
MKTLEYWVLRIADSDWTWVGFNWLRPAKNHRVSLGYILFSSFLLGSPGLIVGFGFLYVFFGRIEPKIGLSIFTLVMFFELLMHLVFAHYWNQRARKLIDGVPAPA